MNLSNRKNPQEFEPRMDDSLPRKVAVDQGRPGVLEGSRLPAYEGPAKGGATETVAAHDRGPRKGDFAKPRLPRGSRAAVDLPPMQTAERANEQEKPVEAYVRMRVLVDGDTLKVLDSHLVEGPLREGDSFPGRYAYDVTLGADLLHAGPAPDLGVRRSFIPPDADENERTHHDTALDRTIFTVRVSAEQLTAARLPEIQVTLYRLKDEATGNASREALPSRFPRSTRVVAARSGLPRSVLPTEIRRRDAQAE